MWTKEPRGFTKLVEMKPRSWVEPEWMKELRGWTEPAEIKELGGLVG